MTKNKEQKRIVYLGYHEHWKRLVKSGEIPKDSILVDNVGALLGIRDFKVIWGHHWVRLFDAEAIHREIELRK